MFTIDDIKKFIFRYNPNGLIVDTNILIVFLIGSFDQDFIGDCKVINNSCKKYNSSDYDLLLTIFSLFKKIVITPQIMAEVSNLSITKGITGEKLAKYLKKVIDFLKSSDEQYVKHDYLFGLQVEVIGQFGFTDMSMYELSKKTNMPILTDELRLYTHVYGNAPIIKYEHIRNQEIQSKLDSISN